MLAVTQKLRELAPKNVVIDPVMYAKHGSALMAEESISTLISDVIPLADLITPNIPEAEKISGIKIKNRDDMKHAAKLIFEMGCKAVVVKGGHSEGDATDVLYAGGEFFEYTSPRFCTKHTHGTGCTFSSAIASNLALGFSVDKAVKKAKDYTFLAIANAPKLGRGSGPIHHFYQMYKCYFGEDNRE
jgi:hydroxymethylpyrimidine/phosphomethylpyrimidine kinase